MNLETKERCTLPSKYLLSALGTFLSFLAGLGQISRTISMLPGPNEPMNYSTRARACIFFTPFLKAIYLISRRFFHKIMSLCMVNIQERILMARVR